VIPGKTYKPEDIVEAAWRRRWMIVGPFVLIAVASVVIAAIQPDRYRSEALLQIVPQQVPPDQPALRDFLRDALAYLALYYALWAGADVLIQIAGLDVGWLLRVVPNQLYYAFWIPFVVARFFARR